MLSAINGQETLDILKGAWTAIHPVTPVLFHYKERLGYSNKPAGKKCILMTSWRPVLKTGLQDVYEDLKTLTNPSFWRRIFKVPKTSILVVFKLKLVSLFKTVKYRLQHVIIAFLETCFEDWSSRRVWKLTNVNRPVVLKAYFQSPQDQFSKLLIYLQTIGNLNVLNLNVQSVNVKFNSIITLLEVARHKKSTFMPYVYNKLGYTIYLIYHLF